MVLTFSFAFIVAVPCSILQSVVAIHIRGSGASNHTRSKCGGQSFREDGLPDGNGTPEQYCPLCRKCCDCNANDAMDCSQSTVSGDGFVVFCSTCESSCSSCEAFSSMTMCPHGDCCAPGWKHHPPFEATRGTGAYGFHLKSSHILNVTSNSSNSSSFSADSNESVAYKQPTTTIQPHAPTIILSKLRH
mmetsp:Transcript_28648/g.46108  ORF Transcript_28648/g.46108 Transcript_28648/m.46108 type:complete len:189 (-) Transcript_28648:111-677(-)